MLITNGKLFLDGKFCENAWLRTDNGHIAEIGSGKPSQTSDEPMYDLQGNSLIPGFVDVHIHAYRGCDTMQGEQAVRAMSRELKKVGVAAFCPTTMSASPEDTRAALAGIWAVMQQPEPNGAAVLGAHMEAPFLSACKAGAQVKEHFAMPTAENWERYTGEYGQAVRTVTLAPELDGAMGLIPLLEKKGIAVSIGHTNADAETVHCAAAHGASRITHTFNAQTPLNHRAPGVPGAAMCDDRLYCEFIGDGIHLHPDIVRLIVRCKQSTRAVGITDAMEAAGMPDGEYALGGQAVYVKNGAARLADGTLAGSTLTMKQALLNLLAFGIAKEDAVRILTETPANAIKEKHYGRIAVGCAAVFAVLDEQGQLADVIG